MTVKQLIMENTTLFLAEFWGWFIIIFCVILLINPKRASRLIMALEHEKHLVIPAVLSITLGLVSVLLHNVWSLNWMLIITLLGWGTLLKGIHLFAFPKNSLKLVDAINQRWLPLYYTALFLLGFILLNQVYQIVPY